MHNAKQLRKANRERSEKQTRVRACLDYLGIEDTRLLDNYKPLTHTKIIVPKTEEVAVYRPEEGTFPTEVMTHFFIDKYPGDLEAKKLMPISRSLVRIDGEVMRLEKTQFPAHENDQPKRLKVAKFDDNELELICDKRLSHERHQWMLILADKVEKDPTYLEKVSKPVISNDFFKTALLKKDIKHKLFIIHSQIQAALENARMEKGLLSREEQA